MMAPAPRTRCGNLSSILTYIGVPITSEDNMADPFRKFRPLDRTTADEMIALINKAVGSSNQSIVLLHKNPPGFSTMGTNLESAEDVVEFMKDFFHIENVKIMFERSGDPIKKIE
jgi:hypothetical protein